MFDKKMLNKNFFIGINIDKILKITVELFQK